MTAPAEASAVLVAGGRGERFGGDLPKQFLPLAGRPVLLHAIAALAAVPGVREIAVVLPAEGVPETIERALADRPGPVLRRAVAGARRQDSVAAGLAALSSARGAVLVHDAARPFPPPRAVAEVIARCLAVGGAILALPAADALKREGPGRLVGGALDRASVWHAQTPQAFRADLLPRVLDLLRAQAELPDEAAALEILGVPVALVPGSPSNLKITRPEDLRIAEALLGHGLV